jgi:DNA primase catalytic core
MKESDLRDLIEKVKERTDIVQVIGQRIKLSPRHKAQCPFHDDKHPSFSVNPEAQYYYCFGCRAGGDVIDFIQRYENKSFTEALLYLASQAGIPIPSATPEAEQRIDEDRKLDQIRMEAIGFYHRSVTPEVASYLTKDRGLGADTIVRFQIGYANGGLRNHLIARCRYQEDLCLKSGFLKMEADGQVRDYFYHEIIFPNWHCGRVAYVTGRGYPRKSHKKPRAEEFPLEHLFCEHALREKAVILTEGEIDTYTLIQAGFNACGILGVTSFKEGWVSKFKNADTIYISLDGDDAGREAALRLGEMFGERARIVPFPDAPTPNGERIKDWNELFVTRHRCNVDSFSQEYQRLLDHAQTVLEYRIRSIPKDIPKQDLPRVLSPIVAELARLTELEQEIYVDVMVDHFRDTLKLSRQALRADIKRAAKKLPKSETEEVEILDGKYPRISPALDFVDGTGYICVPVDVKLSAFVKGATVTRIAKVPYVVTSNREFFRIDKEELLAERKLVLKSEPHFLDGAPRWSIEHIRQFQDPGCRIEPTVAFETVARIYDSYVDFKEEHTAQVMALWTLGTYVYPIFESYPYLSFTGERSSGKTKTLTVAERLCFNAVCSSDISPSLLFRIIEGSSCTVLIDEAERLKDPRLGQDLRLLLNAGYKRGGRAHRSKPDTFEPQSFEVYSPKMLANIKGLEGVLESRCIQFTMLRTRDTAKANRIVTEASDDWAQVRHMLYAFAMTAFQEIRQEYLEDGETKSIKAISGREGELWHPLLAIARYLDKNGCPGLFEEIKEVAVRKAQEGKADGLDEWSNAMLLALRDITTLGEDNISTRDIRDAMNRYLEDGSEPPSSHWVGAALGRLGLAEKSDRGGKGYRYVVRQATVEDVIERYGV